MSFRLIFELGMEIYNLCLIICINYKLLSLSKTFIL